MQVINLKIFVTSLFIWAVTTVAAQNSIDSVFAHRDSAVQTRLTALAAQSIEIVVHRGANALAPENTMASTDKVMVACQEDDTSQFQLVIDKKADLVNLDRPEVFIRLLPSCKAQPGMSTQELQSLIDQMHCQGGGRVIFSKGRYVTGQLELKSGVELHLEEGAVLLGSTSPFDYRQVEGKQAAGDALKDKSQLGLIVAKGAHHIAITGKGTIDGQGLALALTIDSLHHVQHTMNL